jgi:hypothetical protein
VSWDKTARIWQIDPIVLMLADQRQGYVCREAVHRLHGINRLSTVSLMPSGGLAR